MLAESKRLEAEINSLRLQLKDLPEGKLIISPDRQYQKWYISHNASRKYLPKTNRSLAEQLALKKYLTLNLKRLLQEKQAIDAFLKLFPSIPNPASALLVPESPFSELLTSQFQTDSTELQKWMHSDYEKNPLHPENLIHKTSSGNLVRSKSEALIDTLLYVNKIPYRYECALHFGEITIYPDFTILHPITRKIIYWEHFGLMDDPLYSKNAYSKLHLYTSNGIIPSQQLITTFETSKFPLNSEYVNNLIQLHFLQL